MAGCNLCPRGCVSAPFCKKGEQIKIAAAMLHTWEEPCISGKNGAGTVFFSGCNLSCVYCQNHKISHKNLGKTVSESELRKIFNDLISQGAHNIELVTPTHYMDKVLPALSPKLPVPVIYNCSGYESVEALKQLEGRVDIYMPDMKYAFSSLSKKYSHVYDYFEKNLLAIEEMYRQVGDCEYDENGMLKKGVIVRHLILPGELVNTKSVIKNFAELSKGRKMLFSLMAQYTPVSELNLDKFENLKRPITEREYKSAVEYLSQFENIKGFTQELTSTGEEYIPSFNFTE